MGTPNFSPASINSGVVPPGQNHDDLTSKVIGIVALWEPSENSADFRSAEFRVMMKCERSNDSLVGSVDATDSTPDSIRLLMKWTFLARRSSLAMMRVARCSRQSRRPRRSLGGRSACRSPPRPLPLPGSTFPVEVAGDCFPLGLEAKAADSLPLGRNSEITHEFAVRHGFGPFRTFASPRPSTWEVKNPPHSKATSTPPAIPSISQECPPSPAFMVSPLPSRN
jgi:hypothetical protein